MLARMSDYGVDSYDCRESELEAERENARERIWRDIKEEIENTEFAKIFFEKINYISTEQCELVYEEIRKSKY